MEMQRDSQLDDNERSLESQSVSEPSEEALHDAYLTPIVIDIGRAVDLVQSYSSGKYSDGYTGYYWER